MKTWIAKVLVLMIAAAGLLYFKGRGLPSEVQHLF